MSFLKNLFQIAFSDPELEARLAKAKYPRGAKQKDMDRIGRDFAKAFESGGVDGRKDR